MSDEASFDNQVLNLTEWLLESRASHDIARIHAYQLLLAVDDENEVRARAGQVLDPAWLEDDGDGTAPCTLTIVDKLVETIKTLRAAPTSGANQT